MEYRKLGHSDLEISAITFGAEVGCGEIPIATMPLKL